MSELIEILNGNTKSVTRSVAEGAESGALSLEVLRELNEAESQRQKRQPVLAALAKAMDTLVNQAPVDDSAAEGSQGESQNDAADKTQQKPPAEKPADAAKQKQGGKAERGETPEWKKPDYTGPITCEQAMWRNKNISRK